MKRILSAALSVCLLAGLLAGCSSDNSGGGKGNTPMGRYVEEQGETLPNLTRVFNFHRSGGDVIFYGQEKDGDRAFYYRYVLPAGGGEIQKSELTWLSEYLMAGNGMLDTISESGNGTVYFLYYDAGYKSRLARSVDGGAPEELEVPELTAGGFGGMTIGGVNGSSGSVSLGRSDAGAADITGSDTAEGGTADTPPEPTPAPSGEPDDVLTAPNGSSGGFVFSEEGESQLYVNGVVALDDGFLLLFGSDGVYRYDADGVKKTEFFGTAYESGVALLGSTLLMGDAEGKGMVTYDMETAKQSGAYTYESKDFRLTLGMDDKGIYLADSTGIYRQAEGGTIWERLVDGSITSLVMPNTTIAGLASDGGDGFHAILSLGDQGYQLVRYYYDENTPTTPDTELTIFALNDNPTVRQTIGEFQRRNPNVRVNFRVALGDDSAATVEDVIRALNTEILGGKGPDILLLDGLPVDSYIEKGVLADLSALVEKLSGDGLMSNLMSAYERGGKIYGVPSRFSVPVMMGNGADLAGLDGLEALAKALEDDAGGGPPLLWGPSDLWAEDMPGMLMRYYESCTDEFFRDGALDEAALTRYFELAERIDKAVKAYTPQIDSSAMITIAISTSGSAGFEALDSGAMMLGQGKARMHIQELGGKFSLSSIISKLSGRPGYELKALFGGDRYTPVGGVGIVASGKQQELAASFLELLLSRTVQDKYLYDGFPVNQQSLEQMVKEVMDNGETMVDITLDKPEISQSGAKSEMGFLELCKSLKTPILTDRVVEEAVNAQAMELAAGKTTPAEAAAKVVEKTRLYLAE